MADTLDINQHLSTLGLNQIEAKTYLILLTNGITPILRLSKQLNLPRTSVYRLCQKLVDQQFLTWVVTRQGNKIRAVDPSQLNNLIKAQETKLTATKSAISSLTEFKTTLATQLPQTQVRYYHGKSGMMQIIWNTLQSKSGIIGYSGFYRSDIVGMKFEDQYAEERNSLQITDTVIVNSVSPTLRNTLDHHPNQLKYTKLFLLNKPDFKIPGDTYIYNDIYAVNFYDSEEIVGIEIQNRELVALQINIFNQLLALSKPYSDS